MNKNYLLDDVFLEQLDNQKQREIWVKILALTLDEEPVEEIAGRVTGGSISIDGKSKLRRSCSLNLISQQLDINEYVWCLNTKIKVSIGIKNEVDTKKYDEIIWFPQGTFVLNSFNISINNTSSTISLQGKDKMCLLNGDVGGNLTALSYAFDIVEEENGYNSYYKRKLPLKYIIREAVHTYANEPYHNIIINDLDDYGFELLTYRGEEPMYFVYSLDKQDITGFTINPDQEYTFNGVVQSIANLENNPTFKFKVLNDFVTQDHTSASTVTSDGHSYQLIKIEYGMTCGYRITDLIYPSELVLNVGDGLTSMLDKLVTMLGNFEYFYNLDGQFIFQRKPTFVHTSWNTIVNNGEEQWVADASYNSSHVYSLYDSKLVSSFSNSPALNNVKNDFSIWGTRKGVTGVEMPIHMRYAIDRKPMYYTTVEGQTYTTRTKEQAEEDQKSGVLELLGKGYSKEPTRFGLNEDWWEVRDWANAWIYSGLPVPDKTLGTYCKTQVILYPEDEKPEDIIQRYPDRVPYPVPRDVWNSWKISINTKYIITEDMIFHGDGTHWDHHGKCSHNYQTYWIKSFEEGERYSGGYAYFYKPQMPAEEVIANGGQGLILRKDPIYEADWRELIYQMAKDHNKFGNMDNNNPEAQLVKVYSAKEGKDVIITKETYNNSVAGYYTNPRDISLLTAIRTQNPTFYPSGYTGYEQYYIDILGFWRQLYNPDYKGSYDIEPITRLDYEAVTEPETLFYDAPVYEACDKNSIWYDDITYYIKTADGKYVAEPMLTEIEFNKNKSGNKYYYVADVEIAPVEIEELPVNSGEDYYKIENYSQTVKGSALTTRDQKKLYCKKNIETHRIPIFKLEPFHRAYLYNTYDRGVFKEVKQGILRSDYEGSPWFYYRNKDGVQTCCTSIGIAENKNRPQTCWFENSTKTVINWSYLLKVVGENEEVTSSSISFNRDTKNSDLEAVCKDIMRNPDNSSKTLKEKLAMLPWYFCYETYTYEPLVRPKLPFDPQGTYYVKSDIQEFNYKDDNPPYWKTDLLTNPESLIFWFDFLDTDGELDTYNVQRIGDRPKAVNDKDVKAIYFRETPEVLFLEPDEWQQYATGSEAWKKPTGYAYAQMPKYLQHLFAISSQGKSAKDVLDEFLYQYSYCTETVSITALPIYHLEPNTRILVHDDKSHINGEYIIEKLTVPLDPKGTMNISATKAIDRLY